VCGISHQSDYCVEITKDLTTKELFSLSDFIEKWAQNRNNM
jgi:hypothetical protein